MRLPLLLALGVLAACEPDPMSFFSSSEPASCAALGGRCQTPDLPCPDGAEFAGYDRCGDSDSYACCVPEPIVCGDATCNAVTEICVGCDDGVAPNDMRCIEIGEMALSPIIGQVSESTGCGTYTSLWLECDDSADCSVGQKCVFSSGEGGYALCADAGTGIGVACTSSADCGGDAECRPYVHGQFGWYADLLGWTPHACSRPR